MQFFLNNFISFLKRTLDFSGKATRKEWWSFLLVDWTIVFLIALIIPQLGGLYLLGMILPRLSILIKRFRDADVTPYAIFFILPIYVVVFLKSK